MKADKKGDNKADLVELRGKIVKKKFAAGSKSEHNAFFLETDKTSYHLRRLGGNPFADAKLKELLGQRIIAKGIITGSLFIAHSIEKA